MAHYKDSEHVNHSYEEGFAKVYPPNAEGVQAGIYICRHCNYEIAVPEEIRKPPPYTDCKSHNPVSSALEACKVSVAAKKGRQFGGREGARYEVTLWPAVGAGMERKRLLLL